MASKVNLDVSERLDITCRKGDTFSLTVTLKDSTGTVITLATSSYTFLMEVWSTSRTATAPVIGSTTSAPTGDASFETFVTDDVGNVTISATATTMKTVPAGAYKYDLQYMVGDTHTTILHGSFVVNDDVSKHS